MRTLIAALALATSIVSTAEAAVSKGVDSAPKPPPVFNLGGEVPCTFAHAMPMGGYPSHPEYGLYFNYGSPDYGNVTLLNKCANFPASFGSAFGSNFFAVNRFAKNRDGSRSGLPINFYATAKLSSSARYIHFYAIGQSNRQIKLSLYRSSKFVKSYPYTLIGRQQIIKVDHRSSGGDFDQVIISDTGALKVDWLMFDGFVVK